MKSLFLILLTFSSVSSFAFECAQDESQFIGKATAVDSAKCTFQIEFARYDGSVFCPLLMEDVVNVNFPDKSCSLKNGDFVSGYLVRNNSTNEIVLE